MRAACVKSFPRRNRGASLSNKWAGVSAAIYGCAGESLTPDEKALFREVSPYGFILFARNCKDREQIKKLIGEMRDVSGRKDVPVLIDQEGGRVMRLTPPIWRSIPPAEVFAAIAEDGRKEDARRAVYLNSRMIAHDLAELGVNVDCAPLLDVRAPGAHDIIGDRAFGSDPEQVALLGRAMCDGLMAGGVMPVIKHIPGHGRAKADSHIELPVVDTPADLLEQIDFAPFKKLSAMPYAMTAHVLYTALDSENVATFSAKIITMIREKIGFDGVLMSDDFSMKALSGSFAERTKRAFSAGCDLALHCNGNFGEMKEIAENTPELSAATIGRIEKIKTMTRKSDKLDYAAALAEMNSLLCKANA